jgi:hypothetical protein
MTSRVKGALLLTLSFGLGCLAGAAAYKLALDRPPAWRGGPDRAERFEKAVLKRLARDLSLQPQQEQRVETILRETGQEFRRLRDEIGPRFDEIRKHGEERIRGVLDREQQGRFTELVAKWNRRMERWRSRDTAPGSDQRKGP